MLAITPPNSPQRGPDRNPDRFQARDVVRHPLVQRIVEAYDDLDASQTTSLDKSRS